MLCENSIIQTEFSRSPKGVSAYGPAKSNRTMILRSCILFTTPSLIVFCANAKSFVYVAKSERVVLCGYPLYMVWLYRANRGISITLMITSQRPSQNPKNTSESGALQRQMRACPSPLLYKASMVLTLRQKQVQVRQAYVKPSFDCDYCSELACSQPKDFSCSAGFKVTKYNCQKDINNASRTIPWREPIIDATCHDKYYGLENVVLRNASSTS